ncbi:MAG: hypothetical protein C0624_03620 [Desulfuromonas sp.]|nr:MAG: hypothetical protein C0624_03620 [Desulfuromonas sp.]
MGFGWFVVVSGAAAGCYYGYRKLQRIEEEIREEISAKGLAADEEVSPAAKEQPGTPPPVTPNNNLAEKPVAAGSMEERILAEVKAQPEILQTELYKKFADSERKALQAALLKMDKAGALKRAKEKSTYRLVLP